MAIHSTPIGVPELRIKLSDLQLASIGKKWMVLRIVPLKHACEMVGLFAKNISQRIAAGPGKVKHFLAKSPKEFVQKYPTPDIGKQHGG